METDPVETIKIFDVVEEEEVTSNKTQKEIQYEEIKKSSIVESYHFDNYYEMDVKEELLAKPKTNIISINCLYVLQYCHPILDAEQNTLDIDKSKMRNGDEKTSISKAMKLPSKTVTDVEYSIPIQFSTPRRYYDTNFNTKYTEVGKQLFICGILIPNILMRYYDEYVLIDSNHQSKEQIAVSGNYGLYQYYTYQYTNAKRWANPLGVSSNIERYGKHKKINESIEDIRLSDGIVIIFKNEEHANQILKFMSDYIDYLHNYYLGGITSLQLTMDNVISSYNEDLKNHNQTAKWHFQFAKEDNVLSSIDNIQQGKFDYSYDINIANQLGNSGLMYLYNIGRFLSVNNEYFISTLNEAKKNNLYKAKLLDEYNKAFAKKLELVKKNVIAENKYNKLYLKLNKREIEIVDKIYKTTEKMSEEDAKIRDMFKEAHESTNPGQLRKILSTIEKTIPNKDLNGDHLLRGGVCPHTYLILKTTAELFGKPWLGSELREKLISSYSNGINDNGYYCKICGGLLAESQDEVSISFLTQDASRYIDIPDEIQTMIFKESLYILSSYIKFSIAVNLKPIASTLTNGLRGIIGEQNRLLMKNRSNTSETIKDILLIYINIYIYACLCAMMMNNPDKLKFGKEKAETKGGNTKKKAKKKAYIDTENLDELIIRNDKTKVKYGGVVTKDAKLYERFILTTSINLIILSKDSIVKRSKSINGDIIKQVFLKTAYPWARKHIKSINLVSNMEEDNKFEINALTRYIAYVKGVDLNKLDKNKTNRKFNNEIDRILLSVNTNESTKGIKNIYAEMTLPPKPKIFNDYQYDSFKSIYEYLKDGIWLMNINSSGFKQYIDKYEYLLEDEKKQKYERDIWKIKPNYRIIVVNDIAKYNNFKNINPNRFYCPSGEKHDGSIYVYQDKKSKTANRNEDKLEKEDLLNIVEFDKDKIKEMTKAGTINELFDMKYIGQKCKKCKNIISLIDCYDKNVDKTKFYSMLKKKNNITAFYEYYTVRCPEGDLHEYNKDNECKKCGIDTNQLQTSLKKGEQDSYYTKYITKFKEIEKIQQKITIESLQDISNEIESSKKEKQSDNKTEYKETFNSIAEWSQLLNVKYNTLINIGLTEQNKFSDINEGKINPSKNTGWSQAMRVKMYILEIIREYNSILNYKFTTYLNPEVKKIIDMYRKDNINFDLSTMYQVDPNYLKLENKYRYSLPIELLVNFNLDYLARLIINISKNVDNKYKGFAKSLAEYFTNKIVDEEILFSKPTPLSKKTNNEGEESSTDDVGTQEESHEEEASEEEEDEAIGDHFDLENPNDVWEKD